MTPQALKRAMEEQWAKPDCAMPLRIARWRVTAYGRLSPYHDPDVADEDESFPLDALAPR